MSYDYKIINTDPNLAFVKRAVLYLAILSLTVGLALVVLFLLFERYLMLILPGIMILFFALTCFFVGRSPAAYSYHFTEKYLELEGNGRATLKIALEDIKVEKNAEFSDFSQKKNIKYTFWKNRIIVKNNTNENSFSVKSVFALVRNERYLLALDDYARTLVRGATHEV